MAVPHKTWCHLMICSSPCNFGLPGACPSCPSRSWCALSDRPHWSRCCRRCHFYPSYAVRVSHQTHLRDGCADGGGGGGALHLILEFNWRDFLWLWCWLQWYWLLLTAVMFAMAQQIRWHNTIISQLIEHILMATDRYVKRSSKPLHKLMSLR